MLDPSTYKTELEKRMQNQTKFNSFSLVKKILVRLQEIIMSIGTNETTDIIRKFDTSYIRVDGWTDMVIQDEYKLDYKIVLFQLKGAENYLLRIESRFSANDAGHKNFIYNYQLSGRKRYDQLRYDLQVLLRTSRPSEYDASKAGIYHHLNKELTSISLQECICPIL